MGSSRSPIVVGVAAEIKSSNGADLNTEWDGMIHRPAPDRGDASGLAVEWAAAEAASQGRPLRIVHAVPPRLPLDLYGVGVPPWEPPVTHTVVTEADRAAFLRPRARYALRTALWRARRMAPELSVRPVAAYGLPAPVLREQSRQAHLIVVGKNQSRTLGSLRRLCRGSVSEQLAALAFCPVVVAPVRSPDRAISSRDGGPPRVVVEVTEPPLDDRAMMLAFEAARQRGLPLTAILLASRPALGRLAAGQTDLASHGHDLANWALHSWHALYPDVDLNAISIAGAHAEALTYYARNAALLVLSATGEGAGRFRPHSGWRTVRRVLRHVNGPTAVAHGMVQARKAPRGR